MSSYNRIIMMGNLTKDPELDQKSGKVKFSIASSRKFKNRQTNVLTEEVCFVDVEVWGAQAETCQKYLSKGRSVLVEGRLKLNRWQTADGQKRSQHLIGAESITFLNNGQTRDGASSSDDLLDQSDLLDSKSSDAGHGFSGEIKFDGEPPF